jgi:hypothetical protein
MATDCNCYGLQSFLTNSFSPSFILKRERIGSKGDLRFIRNWTRTFFLLLRSSEKVTVAQPTLYINFLYVFLKGLRLRFITLYFSELLKLSREYQMLTVTKVTDFRWTRSQGVQSNSVRSLRLQKPSPTLIGIALQANRAESLPFLSIRVASLL